MIIYKYLHPDRVDILKNGTIRFTQPAAFNDPFETMPCYTTYKEYAKERLIHDFEETFGMATPPEILESLPQLINEQIDNLQQLYSEHFGVLSLTKERNNLLMWAHYADSHRGLVVGFDSESTFFKPGKGKGLQGLREVKYSQKREVVPRGGMAVLEGEELEKLNDAFFFTKSDNWSYEEELRILAHPKVADVTLKGVDGYNICLFEFPSECIREVIAGYRSSSILRRDVADILANKYPHASLFKAVLNETEFNLDIVPDSA